MQLRYPGLCRSGQEPAPPKPPVPPHQATLGSSAPSADAQGSGVVVDPGTTVSCPAQGDPCTADATVTVRSTGGRRAVVASAHFAIPAGRKARLRLRLTHTGAKLLRRAGTLR